jgi:hypothetical protein
MVIVENHTTNDIRSYFEIVEKDLSDMDLRYRLMKTAVAEFTSAMQSLETQINERKHQIQIDVERALKLIA